MKSQFFRYCLRAIWLICLTSSLSCKQRALSDIDHQLLEKEYADLFKRAVTGETIRICVYNRTNDLETAFLKEAVEAAARPWLSQLKIFQKDVQQQIEFSCLPFDLFINFSPYAGRSFHSDKKITHIFRGYAENDEGIENESKSIPEIPYSKKIIRSLLMHELGHAFGLNDTYYEHNDDFDQYGQYNKAIMRSHVEVRHGSLTYDDRMGLASFFSFNNYPINPDQSIISKLSTEPFLLLLIAATGRDSFLSNMRCDYGFIRSIVDFLEPELRKRPNGRVRRLLTKYILGANDKEKKYVAIVKGGNTDRTKYSLGVDLQSQFGDVFLASKSRYDAAGLILCRSPSGLKFFSHVLKNYLEAAEAKIINEALTSLTTTKNKVLISDPKRTALLQTNDLVFLSKFLYNLKYDDLWANPFASATTVLAEIGREVKTAKNIYQLRQLRLKGRISALDFQAAPRNESVFEVEGKGHLVGYFKPVQGAMAFYEKGYDFVRFFCDTGIDAQTGETSGLCLNTTYTEGIYRMKNHPESENWFDRKFLLQKEHKASKYDLRSPESLYYFEYLIRREPNFIEREFLNE